MPDQMHEDVDFQARASMIERKGVPKSSQKAMSIIDKVVKERKETEDGVAVGRLERKPSKLKQQNSIERLDTEQAATERKMLATCGEEDDDQDDDEESQQRRQEVEM